MTKKVKRPPKARVARHRKVVAKHKIRRSSPLRRRILLHPFSIFVFLCMGVLIAGWTYKVVADTFTVTAVIEAPPLNEGAVITSPQDGAVITSIPITVSGLCPSNSYVKLYDNNVFSGVAWCVGSGTFSIETDLYLGQNVLLAQDYNQTDDPGPTTPTVTVTYSPPASQGTGSPTTTHTSPSTGPSKSSGTSHSKTTSPTTPSNVAPLLLYADFHFQTFPVNSNFTWMVNISGGVTPYQISINWGDGTSSGFSLKGGPSFTIQHKYTKIGYYPIIVSASDSAGSSKLLQLAALIKNPNSVGIYNPTAPTVIKQNQGWIERIFNHSSEWLWIAWPSYIILLLMLLSYYLGERREYERIYLSKKLNKFNKPPLRGSR